MSFLNNFAVEKEADSINFCMHHVLLKIWKQIWIFRCEKSTRFFQQKFFFIFCPFPAYLTTYIYHQIHRADIIYDCRHRNGWNLKTSAIKWPIKILKHINFEQSVQFYTHFLTQPAALEKFSLFMIEQTYPEKNYMETRF